ncbi:hypothetical protein F3Y22_tig00116958pilonHSYRG00122 [Hibiscus syriacus]|uniref:Uncharacterized protein n=1 Tax=Hibiscus syriacus TaxID=106335 RepID=A0A6A2WL13_HIBSY|nr:hypothetical protein F3Y22_tig00116958pilonHSYRG00122 [Hibiscus syriacus]
MDAMKKINEDIKYHEKKQLEIDHQIRELRLHQANRVTFELDFLILDRLQFLVGMECYAFDARFNYFSAQMNQPAAQSLLHYDNPTVFNVLVDVKSRLDVESDFMVKRMKLGDVQKSHALDAIVLPESTTNELLQEILDAKMLIKKEALLEKLKEKFNAAEEKTKTLDLSFEDFGESTKEEVEAFQEA